MGTQTMSNEENYRFDVAGYLIIPGVLTAAELKACNRALDQRDSSNGPLRWTGPADNPLVAAFARWLRRSETTDRRWRMDRLVTSLSPAQWRPFLSGRTGVLGAGGTGAGRRRAGGGAGESQ